MKAWKRFLASIMSVVLVVGLCPGLAFADDAASGGGDLTPVGQLSADLTAQADTPAALDYSGDAVSFIGADGKAFGMFTSQDGTTITLSGDQVKIHYVPKNKTIYKGFFLNKGIAEETTGDPDVLLANGAFDFTVSATNCGKAIPIKPIKVADGGTTASQYYLAIPPKDKLPAVVSLTITNNTGMFKAVTASAVKNTDGTATLTMALSSTGYHYLYKGTYEQAVANGDKVENWIAGAENADKKWEFQIPISADELGKEVPVVAISQSYYEKYQKKENAIERAFYPRQLNLDLAKATLTTGDFEVTQEIAVTNNVSMFKPSAKATLNTVGGPNSNNYAATLVLPMDSEAMSAAYVGTPLEAKKADATEEKEGVVAFADDKTFSIPVKWVAEFGKPETVVNHADGKPFVISFKSKSNDKWYGRQATLDENAGTLVFDPWTDPAGLDQIDKLGTPEAVAAALKDGSLVATPDLAANLIDAIYVQSRNDKTDLYCASAKLVWDALTPEQQEQVEGVNADPGYFGDDTGDASKDDPLNADKIGENEILVVSFGTSFNGSRAADIGGVEKAIAAAYPDWSVRRAFTAQIIINHVQARDGEIIDNVEQALARAEANGVKNLIVQPTHLMHGAEYDELVEALAPYKDKMNITVNEPLLGEVGKDATVVNNDKMVVAEAVVAAACKDAKYADAAAAAADGTAIVLMGHGTEHVANVTYEQMQTAMANLGYKNVFIGTVEGLPESTECQNVIKAVKDAGYKKVILRPLMVVAGDHANNDMADPEDPDSWYSQFTASKAFDKVDTQIAGLGEVKTIQDLYVSHINGSTETVYRLYHPVTGEHHYTKDANERNVCINEWGWNDEGVAWVTPKLSMTPVYRVYDLWTGEHHYTSDANEQKELVGSGRWRDEGIAWYSDAAKTVTVYRLERHDRGPLQHHHYTLDEVERNTCLNEWGWNDEQIGWYATVATK